MEGLEDALLQSFIWLATCSSSPVRYSWPLYVRCLLTVDSELRDMASGLLSSLKDCELIINDGQSGSLSPNPRPVYLQPSEVWFVGQKYRHKGQPLITTDDFVETIGSPSYSLEAQDALLHLDAKKLNKHAFVVEIGRMLSEDETNFQEQPRDWHERFASTLHRIVCSDPSLERICKSLNLVPLQNGEWTSAKNNKIFISESLSQVLPGGLEEIQFVGLPSADLTQSQRLLYMALGVPPADPARICTAIIREHKCQTSIPTSHLIEHARYLFQAGYRRTKRDRLLFCDSESYITTDHSVVISLREAGISVV